MGGSSTDAQRKQKKKRRKKRESLGRNFQIWLSCTAVNSGRFGVELVCVHNHKICAGETTTSSSEQREEPQGMKERST